MSNNLGIDPEVLAAASAALRDFIHQTPSYYPTEQNKNILIKFLKSEGIGPENWSSPKVWAAAFWSCTRADSQFPLEPVPPRETPQERAMRLELQDRHDGSAVGNTSRALKRETEEDRVRKLVEQKKDFEAREKQRLADAEAERVRQDAAEHDISGIPTVAQFRDSAFVPWTAAQLRPLSAIQLRRYMSREAEAKHLNAMAAGAVREQRIKDRQNE